MRSLAGGVRRVRHLRLQAVVLAGGIERAVSHRPHPLRLRPARGHVSIARVTLGGVTG